ncbi:MAG: phasin family protein [Defluviicoccus sp.]
MSTSQENFLNPSRITETLMGKFKDLGVSGLDVDALVASQRKNIEALATASRIAMEGVTAVGKRQAEIFKETMSETAQSVQSLVKSGSPRDIAAKQADLTKEGFAKALTNMRELAEMVTKAQTGAMEAITHRVTESLAELQQMGRKATASSAPKAHPAEPVAHTSG